MRACAHLTLKLGITLSFSSGCMHACVSTRSSVIAQLSSLFPNFPVRVCNECFEHMCVLLPQCALSGLSHATAVGQLLMHSLFLIFLVRVWDECSEHMFVLSPQCSVRAVSRHSYVAPCAELSCLCTHRVLHSYKPQKISPKFDGNVRQLLHKKIRESYLHPQVGRPFSILCSTVPHPQFNADVMKPLNIEALMDQDVQNLSGTGVMPGSVEHALLVDTNKQPLLAASSAASIGHPLVQPFLA
eukprot:888425-Pelagomonas_calceolata.AAC.7